MDQLVQRLQSVLDHSVESGEECGCQLTVYRHGKLVCDLVAGYTDNTKQEKIRPDTLFPVFSVGKGIITTLVHVFAERGYIDYNAPVVKYWPEYGVNGKENTLVWQMMSHRAGLYDFPEGFPIPDRFIWEKATAAMETMAPLDKIGGKHHYHAQTYGLLVGRLLEKATGKRMNDLLREAILDPLQIKDIFFGIPDDRLKDMVQIVAPENDPKMAEDGRITYYKPEAFRGINPSSNGTCSARGLARMYAALIENGVDGVKLLKDETLRNATTLRRADDDPVIDPQKEWHKFGLGYALRGSKAPWNRIFGHGGAAGSEAFADFETGYAVGFTKNKLNATHPDHPTRNEISKVLGIPERYW